MIGQKHWQLAASGTEINKQTTACNDRLPIVYTFTDSVFQVAHEEIIPVGKLYEICMTARETLRVISGRRVLPVRLKEQKAISRVPQKADFLKPMKRQSSITLWKTESKAAEN